MPRSNSLSSVLSEGQIGTAGFPCKQYQVIPDAVAILVLETFLSSIWQTACVLQEKRNRTFSVRVRAGDTLGAVDPGAVLFNLFRGNSGDRLLVELSAPRDPDGDPAPDDRDQEGLALFYRCP
ncbi:hypothetical protein DL767_004982 [Monosporascus sp. MG133]|nr:hypothetical protein DL767_004982 [Monosporascus sp. MG133]